jgi:hypothetical protein
VSIQKGVAASEPTVKSSAIVCIKESWQYGKAFEEFPNPLLRTWLMAMNFRGSERA